MLLNAIGMGSYLVPPILPAALYIGAALTLSTDHLSFNLTENKYAMKHFMSDESRLVTTLTHRYQVLGKVARPAKNASRVLIIEFALALIQILDFDETNQVLTTNVWKRYIWKDDILVWRPSDFGGVADVRLPSDMMWTPDIMLYNNADTQEKHHQEMIAVYHDGTLRWIPPAIYKSSCAIDMRNFPFDVQSCYLKFGSWTYDGLKLDMEFFEKDERIDLREYIESSEWDIVSTSAKKNVRYYPCCGDEPYVDITFNLTIRRRTAFYIYVLVLPSVLLSFLTLVLFWIPPQRPDRTSLGMSLFSSFFVLLLILVQSSPPTSASVSLMGIYYCINMIMIAVSTMVSALVINMTHYLQKKRVPPLLRKVAIEWLACVLCAQGNTVITEQENQFNSADGGHGHSEVLNGVHHNKYRENKITAEWRVLASVIDRAFFLFYLTGMVLSMILVFPR